MELEIERKWLVPTSKWELAKEHTTGQQWHGIEQGYLSPECRVRIYTTPDSKPDADSYRDAEISVKQRETLLTVKEYNYEIPVEDAHAILSRLPNIKKNRHTTDSEGYTLDYFLNNLEGLVLVEKEFESEDAAALEQIPAWLIDCPEVTGDPSYLNANLGTAMFVAGVGLVDAENLQTGDDDEFEVDPNFFQM